MTTEIKLNPPYSLSIQQALKEGMTFEMIDAAIGCPSGWSKTFYENYIRLCNQIDGGLPDEIN